MRASASNNKSSRAASNNFKQQFLASLEKEAQKFPSAQLKPMVEARTIAPQLFKNECDPFTFGCRDDDDDNSGSSGGAEIIRSMAKATAQRLVDYWHHRSALFGDRKYLPLDQTGKGALTQKDVALLQTGFVAPLFFTRQEDKENNHTVVLCFNRNRLLVSKGSDNSKNNNNKASHQHYFTAQSKLRCIFYVLALLCQQTARPLAVAGQQQQQRSAFRIRVLMPNVQSNLSHAILRFAACFPVRIVSIHLVNVADAAAEQPASLFLASGSSLRELLPAFVVEQQPASTAAAAAAATAHDDNDDSNNKPMKKAPLLHLAANPADAVAQLQSHGFTLEVIPQELGGNWSYDQFDAWLMDHRQREVGKMLNEIAAQSLGALGDLAAQEMGSEEENKNGGEITKSLARE